MNATPKQIVVLATASLLGCATAPPFFPGRGVDIERGAFGNQYRQNGHPVDLMSMIDAFEQGEATRTEAEAARGSITGGRILGFVGGIALGYGLGKATYPEATASSRMSGLGVAGGGAAVVLVGLLIAKTADDHLERAVDVYNREWQWMAPTSAVAPWIGPTSIFETRRARLVATSTVRRSAKSPLPTLLSLDICDEGGSR